VTEFIQVSTTVNSKERADKIAQKLLGERLASCVQVSGSIRSNYWWKARIERANEWICLIKAGASDYRSIEDSIKKIHPYEVPEILAVPVMHGNADHLNRMRNETARKKARDNSQLNLSLI
jgi:periplasmic divalent cation tolerance protein